MPPLWDDALPCEAVGPPRWDEQQVEAPLQQLKYHGDGLQSCTLQCRHLKLNLQTQFIVRRARRAATLSLSAVSYKYRKPTKSVVPRAIIGPRVERPEGKRPLILTMIHSLLKEYFFNKLQRVAAIIRHKIPDSVYCYVVDAGDNVVRGITDVWSPIL